MSPFGLYLVGVHLDPFFKKKKSIGYYVFQKTIEKHKEWEMIYRYIADTAPTYSTVLYRKCIAHAIFYDAFRIHKILP